MFAKLKQKVQNDSSVNLKNTTSIASSLSDLETKHSLEITNNNYKSLNGSIKSLSLHSEKDEPTAQSQQQDNSQERDDYELRIKDLETKLEKTENSNRNYINEIENLKSELTRINYEQAKIERESEQLKIECDELKVKIGDYKQEINSLNRKYKHLELDNMTAKNSNDDLLIKNAELSENLELLKLVNSKESTKCTPPTSPSAQSSQYDNEILIKTLRDDLNEKNKVIKHLQQRLNDLKKALQKELKFHTSFPNEIAAPAVTSQQAQIVHQQANHQNDNNKKDEQKANGQRPRVKSQSSYPQASSSPTASISSNDPIDEINFKYLKHVLFKFLTSREYEAVHLIKAISVLLKFNKDEENLLRETLEWRTSWFGAKPKLTHKN